jgi:3-deoxy-7-phosphoheptulonate synthase
MIIVLRPDASPAVAQEVMARIAEEGCRPLHLPGSERVVLGALGDERVLEKLHLESHPAVEQVKPILAPYRLVSREARTEDYVVHIGEVPFGGGPLAVIAGPCAIETPDQLHQTGTAVRAAGAHVLRGGAFKPRTSPYSFQGLGEAGLPLLHDIAAELAMPTVTEVVEVQDVNAVAAHADCFQIGARNMQNFRLLKAVGRSDKPVILKRGMAATLDDLLLAAEYIVSEGNPRVILCERGIRTFETAMRNTLDLAAVPYLKHRTHLPVVVDPSHGTGLRELVAPMSLAAVAAGADGLLIEVHHDPTRALSDGQQSLFPAQFEALMQQLASLLPALGRRFA